MANSDRLAEVVAMIVERNEEFAPFEKAAVHPKDDVDPCWSITDLKRLLGYGPNESIKRAIDRAKIAAGNVGWSLKEHFLDGSLFDDADELYLSKYAALLITLNADPAKLPVSVAQAFFALQADRQQLENEKRLRTRLDVATENHRLTGVAKDRGVANFPKFNGMGISALYGGKSVTTVRQMKGLSSKASVLDYAGSEELASNLFRITQTTAALRRQKEKDEQVACDTHERVGNGVRRAIMQAGNMPPEKLPPAKMKIDLIATQTKKLVKSAR